MHARSAPTAANNPPSGLSGLWGLLAVVPLVASLTGCVHPPATVGGGPETDPPTTPTVSVAAAAAQLNMRLVRSGRYSASLDGPGNRLIVLGPPRPGVLLNGRDVAGAEGVVEKDGSLALPSSLLARIRSQLRQPAPPEPPRRSVVPVRTRRPTPRPAGGSPWITVVVDAGHGGHDPGALNGFHGSRLHEKNINLDTARRLERALVARGIRVIMTRSDDTYLTLEERSAIANRAGAAAFISLHADACDRAGARGFTVYTSRSADAASTALARRVAESLAGRTGPSRGIRKADYRVLVKTRCPAILIEQGFLTNRTEAGRLASGSYRATLAEAIADGVAKFVKSRI